jgi:hypothetical protein
MKCNYKLSLTMIASLAIILPMSVFGQDQKPDDKKQETKAAGGQQHGGKVAPQAQSHAATPKGGVNNASGGQGRTNHGAATVQKSSQTQAPPSQQANTRSRSQTQGPPSQQANTRSRSQTQGPPSQQANTRSQSRTQGPASQQGYTGGGNQTQASPNQQAYTRSNNYGGLWSAGNTHSDWSRNGEHEWNHHNYRWYQGGWLIIDEGYSPNFARGGSTASNVQTSLANQGYYNGAIDGDIGPGTRNAIANYQSDHDLRVTGRINDPLLVSLQLE